MFDDYAYTTSIKQLSLKSKIILKRFQIIHFLKNPSIIYETLHFCGEGECMSLPSSNKNRLKIITKN